MKKECSIPSVGILLSTFEQNKKLAHWTAVQISKQWKAHPPLFFSGLVDQHPQNLIFEGDATDWMELTLQAVLGMKERGFKYAYFILDDHPPVGICHEEYLNRQLPLLAEQLNATCISLLGYGQHRPATGVILSQEESLLERCRVDDRWKFSLHPGLWDLEKLELLLKRRMQLYSEKERTVWNFERHRDDLSDPVIGTLLHSCYRIQGEQFLKRKRLMKLQLLIEKMERLLADVLLYGVKTLGGSSLRNKVESELLWLYNHYLGPYPLFWSGTMQKRKPHIGFERWLYRPENKELRKLWKHFKKGECC